jgi:hypothetical protein
VVVVEVVGGDGQVGPVVEIVEVQDRPDTATLTTPRLLRNRA